MKPERIILEDKRFELTLERLCRHLIENHDDFSQSCIIGVQPRGTKVAEELCKRLKEKHQITDIQYGVLDVTFYRDDYRTRVRPLAANPTKMDFLVEDKRVILVDDVLFSGRTIRGALTAIQHYGRPREVELLALVDRRFNRHLPIQADYVGITVDAIDEAYIKVEWEAIHGKNQILLYSEKIS